MSGLELCPKCKMGHLYPVVTTRVSTEPKDQFRETGSIRDYECDICGHKQKAAKQMQNVEVKDKVSARVIKAKNPKAKAKAKAKTNTRPKPKTKAKTTQRLKK